MLSSEPFHNLFRKYRLRAEFETLGEFRDCLAEHGFHYETSIFSHWQKGTRCPKDRKLILQMLCIFSKRKAFSSLAEANAIMSSTGLGYLTDEEIPLLSLQEQPTPFQAPRLCDPYIKRVLLEDALLGSITSGKTVVLTGHSGVGKTMLATRMAHLVRDSFPDGVIWCRLNESSPLSILHSIVESFGEVLPPNVDIDRAARIYRTIVSNKQALYIFDHFASEVPLTHLLPNAPDSGVIITASNPAGLEIGIGSFFLIPSFSHSEITSAKKIVFEEAFLKKNDTALSQLTRLVGSVPIAVIALFKLISHNRVPIKTITSLIGEKGPLLNEFTYDNRTLEQSLLHCYRNLNTSQKKVIRALLAFDQYDSSIEALSYLLNATTVETENELIELISYGFVEKTSENRFRINPLLRILLSKKIATQYLFPKLADFYVTFISKTSENAHFFHLMAKEVNCIIHTLNTTLKYKQYDATFALWSVFGSYYWHVGAWVEFKGLSETIKNLAKANNKSELLLQILLEESSRSYYYDGDIGQAIEYAQEAISLCTNSINNHLKGLAYARYGKLCFVSQNVPEGKEYIDKAISLLKPLKDSELLSHAYRYLSEGYLMEDNIQIAQTLLDTASDYIDKVTNPVRRSMYQSVLYSHYGIIRLLQNNYVQAAEEFKKGVSTGKKHPLVRGTYTWLNQVGLAVSYAQLKYETESVKLLKEACQTMERLGITNSYQTINAYSYRIAPLLETLKITA